MMEANIEKQRVVVICVENKLHIGGKKNERKPEQQDVNWNGRFIIIIFYD